MPTTILIGNSVKKYSDQVLLEKNLIPSLSVLI